MSSDEPSEDLMRQHSLVIFDCDGVLVDSEPMQCRLLAEMAEAAGVPIDDESEELFGGRQLASCIEMIEARGGHPLPADFAQSFRRRSARMFAERLRPIPGVARAIERLSGPRCVASNSRRDYIERVLDLTGLRRLFCDDLFSAYSISRFKPDPGVFLLAAERFAVPPGSCVVVEDSEAGVQAALAAGMEVVAYGSGPRLAALTSMGAHGIDDMACLPEMLAALC
jgi:HAD superfamily hydrolase (TIGR01509 family)